MSRPHRGPSASLLQTGQKSLSWLDGDVIRTSFSTGKCSRASKKVGDAWVIASNAIGPRLQTHIVGVGLGLIVNDWSLEKTLQSITAGGLAPNLRWVSSFLTRRNVVSGGGGNCESVVAAVGNHARNRE